MALINGIEIVGGGGDDRRLSESWERKLWTGRAAMVKGTDNWRLSIWTNKGMNYD